VKSLLQLSQRYSFVGLFPVLAHNSEGPLFQRSTIPKFRVRFRVNVVRVGGFRISRVMVSRVGASLQLGLVDLQNSEPQSSAQPGVMPVMKAM